jgi:hypothetical protein
LAQTEIDSFIDVYTQALQDQTAAVFAGAGLSIPAGMVNWKELMRSIAVDIGLDVDKEDDLVTLAQFHVNERGGRHRINQALVNEFSDRARPTENHRILTSLPIRTYWTTNYDLLIEESLRAAKKIPDVKTSPESLATTTPRRDAVVYKMHGDVSQPINAVVTKDDYESFDSTKRHLFSLALQGDLVSKTFLFIGFSFSDPNLSYILARIRVLLGENRREHFCLLKRVDRKDFSSNAAYQYARAKQDLQVRDLKRYGIIGLLVDSFSEYTEILQRVQRRYRTSWVFISGSAEDYTPFDEVAGQTLIMEISRRLVEAGFGIVTGFGLGVGPYVMNGVLQQLETEGTHLIDDRVIIRPFPQGITDAVERKHRWTAYRKEMLSYAGIAIFVFGNKKDPHGNIILADGLDEEFEIAHSLGISVVPVGCTGSKSRELFDRVIGDYSRYFPKRGLKQKIIKLSRFGNPSDVTDRIINIVRTVRNAN